MSLLPFFDFVDCVPVEFDLLNRNFLESLDTGNIERIHAVFKKAGTLISNMGQPLSRDKLLSPLCFP